MTLRRLIILGVVLIIVMTGSMVALANLGLSYFEKHSDYARGVSDGRQQVLEEIAGQQHGVEKIQSQDGTIYYEVPGDFTDH